MKYKLIKSEKFHNMNATVETVQFDEGMTVKRLVSYSSVVCDVDIATGIVFLYPRHRYSITTTRQVTRFLTEQLGVPIGGVDLNSVARQCKSKGYAVHKSHLWAVREYVLGTTLRW